MIIDLRLRPGMVVDELSLAAEIGLGRTPVHEAVARLVMDRLVTVLPRRGLMIAPIGLEQVREIFEAREAIECGNAYFAVQHATDDDLKEFGRLVMAAEDAREELAQPFVRQRPAVRALEVRDDPLFALGIEEVDALLLLVALQLCDEVESRVQRLDELAVVVGDALA